MRGGDKLSSADLARRTGTHERYVREWLAAQAAAGYVDYDPATTVFARATRYVARRRVCPVTSKRIASRNSTR